MMASVPVHPLDSIRMYQVLRLLHTVLHDVL